MAQTIISLAKEETSNSILSKVNDIKQKTDQILPITTQVGGGYPYVAMKSISYTSSNGEKTVRITGKAKVTFLILNNSFEIKSFSIDTPTTSGTNSLSTSDRLFKIDSSVNSPFCFTCETQAVIVIKSSSTNNSTGVIIAQFANSNGTLTVS